MVNYEIKTLIAIRDEMEEEFTKSTRKQGMISCIKNINIFFINAKLHIQIGPIASYPGPPPPCPPIEDLDILSALEIDPKTFLLERSLEAHIDHKVRFLKLINFLGYVISPNYIICV